MRRDGSRPISPSCRSYYAEDKPFLMSAFGSGHEAEGMRCLLLTQSGHCLPEFAVSFGQAERPAHYCRAGQLSGYGCAMCQAPLRKPSPVMSPGFLSSFQV
jgi:hypothetical protein